MKDLDMVIERGTMHLVNLSTRVTQDAINKLEAFQTILQTERLMPRVSKQEALEKAILLAYECKLQELKKADQEKNAEILQKEIIENDIPEVEIPLQEESVQKESEITKSMQNNFISPSGMKIEDARKFNAHSVHAKSHHLEIVKNAPINNKSIELIQKKVGVVNGG
jgi:hypothetical protein